MKRLQKMIILLILLIVSNVNAQNGVGDTYDEVLIDINNNGSYTNIKTYKDSIICIFDYDGSRIAKDYRYFINDTCYKFMSISDIKNYTKDCVIMNKIFGLPVSENTWIDNRYLNYNYKWYIVSKIYKTKKNSIITITGYRSYDEYNKVITENINK